MHVAPPPIPRDPSWRWALLAAAPALLLAAWQAAFVGPFVSDDAFISLRYADRLLHGLGLTWTDGERVEGYSNLSWVLLCALLGALGLDLVAAARLLGAGCTAVALWALAWAAAPRTLPRAALAALAPFAVASTQVVLGWTLGGLEGPLVLACLALGLALLQRRFAAAPAAALWPRRALLAAGAPFALLAVTRPDGPLWALAAGLGLALAGRSLRIAWWFGLPALLAAGAQLSFRLAYYGALVPNTAHVKAGFDPARLPAGLDYVQAALGAHLGLVLPAALGAALLLGRRDRRALGVVLLLPALLWLGYLVAIGGDHFPGRRLLHGALAPLALLAAAPVLAGPPRLAALAALVVLGGAGWNTYTARTDAQSHELRHEVWEWRGKVLGDALAAAFGAERPLLALDSAGALPFYSRLPCLDLLGLCDATIARTPMPAWIATMRPEIPRPPGHLLGNGAYVLDREPDLVLFLPPPGQPLPMFASGVEMEEDARFGADYRCVLLDLGARAILPGSVEPLVSPLWVRRHGRVGVRLRGEQVVIPAWLFGAFRLEGPIQRRHQPPSGDPAAEAAVAARLQALVQWYSDRPAVAVPDVAGALQLELRAAVPAVADVDLPAGQWKWRLEPASAPLGLEVRKGASAAGGEAFSVPAAGVVQLALVPAAGAALPMRAAAVVLEPVR